MSQPNKQVVITKIGFTTIKEIGKEDKTDQVIFKGTAEECEKVIHGGKK